jgi:hypothetical protein
MNDTLYAMDARVLIGALIALMLILLELGAWLGRRRADRASEALKNHVGNMQGSLLGLSALLLGFTFSLALQRFDSRSDAEVEEANAIGTTVLRAELLPSAQREPVRQLLADYVDLRVAASRVSLDRGAEREALIAQSAALLDRLWTIAVEAAQIDPAPARTGLFLQALNDTIDNLERRDAELKRHVPEVILLLLLASFVLTAGTVGYAVGIASERPPAITHALMLLIALLAFVVIDLDRPRRGLIQVSQDSLLKLQVELHEAAAQRSE